MSDRSMFVHTCGNEGEYLSTACGAANAGATPDQRADLLLVQDEDLADLHQQCRRVCKWCAARCACRTCAHTGPVSWYFVEVRLGRWEVRLDNQVPGRPWPGTLSPDGVSALFTELRSRRWVGEHTPLVKVALPRSFWVGVLAHLAGKGHLL